MRHLFLARSYSVLVLLVLGAGCYSWQRASLPAPPAPNKSAQHFDNVRFYMRGQVVEWHRVRLTHDSISGVPVDKIRTCGDICRRTVGRGDVDSLWLHNLPDRGRVIVCRYPRSHLGVLRNGHQLVTPGRKGVLPNKRVAGGAFGGKLRLCASLHL
jgi:hypothetical protein